MMRILGIDPGASTGLALFSDGRIFSLETIEPWDIERAIRAHNPWRVIFEDSRLQTHAWNARSKSTFGEALATARSLGQVDALCSLICELCGDIGMPAHGISPAAKGKKLKAAAFAQITGWTRRSNQHERDAAMCAWPFRRAFHV